MVYKCIDGQSRTEMLNCRTGPRVQEQAKISCDVAMIARAKSDVCYEVGRVWTNHTRIVEA